MRRLIVVLPSLLSSLFLPRPARRQWVSLPRWVMRLKNLYANNLPACDWLLQYSVTVPSRVRRPGGLRDGADTEARRPPVRVGQAAAAAVSEPRRAAVFRGPGVLLHVPATHFT